MRASGEGVTRTSTPEVRAFIYQVAFRFALLVGAM